MTCCNTYQSNYDPETNTVWCGSCGQLNEGETEVANHFLSLEQQRQSTAEDHQVSNAAHLAENGSKHGYVSPRTKGLCFELGNPRARDYSGKRVPQATLKDGYRTGLTIDRNVIFDKTGKPRVDYNQDKWLITIKQKAKQMCDEIELDGQAAIKVQAGVKKLYSVLMIDDEMIPELFVRMVMQSLPVGMIDKAEHEENNKSLMFTWQRVTELVQSYFVNERSVELEKLFAR